MKMFSESNESSIRKKLAEIHDCDGVITFDSESVLVLIERISYFLTSGRDGMQNGLTADYFVPDELHSMLYKISCVLNCKCLGGDIESSTMEILKVVSSYEWEAKIAIVLASFAVEYAQFSHVTTTLYKNNPLGELVAILKQIPAMDIKSSEEIKARFNSIIQVSIKVVRSIARFTILPSKYISKDVEPMADAFNQIPYAVYVITKVVVACASHLSQTLVQTEITETWDFTILEKTIINIHETFTKQHQQCLIYIEEKKQIKHIVKLRLKFDNTAVYANNQKVLQLLINSKDTDLRAIACGGDEKTAVGVDALRGKTVLLLISDLDISDDEISILNGFYQESRSKQELQYEIVWVPIVEAWDDSFKEKFEDLKMRMEWYSVQHPRLVRAGVIRFVKEDWHYSNHSLLVALDPRGKVANLNAFQMLCTWGNAAYPFTQKRELDIWHRKEWSLEFIIGGIDENISKWIKQDKVICLYGGEDYEWIHTFITHAREVESYGGFDLEMVYIGKNMSTQVTEALSGRSLSWEAESTDNFWRRIQGMGRREVHVQGSKVSKTKESIVVEVRNIDRLGQSQGGWALVSQGAGLGPGKIARGKHDAMLKAFQEFDKWSAAAKDKGFVVALNGYLAGQQLIPEMHVCIHCHRPI